MRRPAQTSDRSLLGQDDDSPLRTGLGDGDFLAVETETCFEMGGLRPLQSRKAGLPERFGSRIRLENDRTAILTVSDKGSREREDTADLNSKDLLQDLAELCPER